MNDYCILMAVCFGFMTSLRFCWLKKRSKMCGPHAWRGKLCNPELSQCVRIFTKMFCPSWGTNGHRSGILNIRSLLALMQWESLLEVLAWAFYSILGWSVAFRWSFKVLLTVLLANCSVQPQQCRNVRAQVGKFLQLIIRVLDISVCFYEGVIFVASIQIWF